jgi:hypothetical protein
VITGSSAVILWDDLRTSLGVNIPQEAVETPEDYTRKGSIFVIVQHAFLQSELHE